MLIQERATPLPAFALFELGFRPFFAAAALFAVLVMGIWMSLYLHSAEWIAPSFGSVYWHAHEMIFGYALAVIAGFLLTAVTNWTGQPGIRGGLLAGLFLPWLAARVLFSMASDTTLIWAASADTLFLLGLILGVVHPVLKVRQWQQMGIIGKLVLLLLANLVFYMGALGFLANGVVTGIYMGLYLVLALLFAMARRVMPFFIEKGVSETFKPRNRKWVDWGSLVLLLLWAVLDLFFAVPRAVGVLSLLLVAVHTLRLADWYTPGIFKVPLLWSLYIGYGFLALGFLFKAGAIWADLPASLAVHAFTVGGIGLMTLGMMSRVGLAHTGRNIFDAPGFLGFIFGLMLVAGLVRVILPIVDMSHYTLWIGLSQLAWMVCFGWFATLYLPFLLSPRTDGRRG
ncbi:MAG: NnrS family protein [Candidatus Thiodiazotropha sp.]